MNAKEYILAKQRAWALRNGIGLVTRAGEGGGLYVPNLDDNLFVPLSESTRECFEGGDGGELGRSGKLGKMQAIHSSSALGVNVFEYWKQIGDATTIAAACGLCRSDSKYIDDIAFEEKYPINDSFPHPPNIDAVIHCKDSSPIKRLAVECKFTETYGSYGHGGLKGRYLTECERDWDGIPALKELAQMICPDDKTFKKLHAAQLIKHVLGLKRQFGKSGFRLLFLWYDAFGTEGAQHHEEVNRFSKVAKADGIHLHAMTYQDLIMRMAKALGSEHSDYAGWLADRYL